MRLRQKVPPRELPVVRESDKRFKRDESNERRVNEMLGDRATIPASRHAGEGLTRPPVVTPA